MDILHNIFSSQHGRRIHNVARYGATRRLWGGGDTARSANRFAHSPLFGPGILPFMCAGLFVVWCGQPARETKLCPDGYIFNAETDTCRTESVTVPPSQPTSLSNITYANGRLHVAVFDRLAGGIKIGQFDGNNFSWEGLDIIGQSVRVAYLALAQAGGKLLLAVSFPDGQLRLYCVEKTNPRMVATKDVQTKFLTLALAGFANGSAMLLGQTYDGIKCWYYHPDEPELIPLEPPGLVGGGAISPPSALYSIDNRAILVSALHPLGLAFLSFDSNQWSGKTIDQHAQVAAVTIFRLAGDLAVLYTDERSERVKLVTSKGGKVHIQDFWTGPEPTNGLPHLVGRMLRAASNPYTHQPIALVSDSTAGALYLVAANPTYSRQLVSCPRGCLAEFGVSMEGKWISVLLMPGDQPSVFKLEVLTGNVSELGE